MRVFDLHCDTLYRAVTESGNFNYNKFEISVDKASYLDEWIQCFALWIPDDMSSYDIQPLFDKAYKFLNNQCKEHNIYCCKDFTEVNNPSARKCFFTVENGRILQGNLENIKKLSDYNVKILTLTWNSDNEIASGALSSSNFGLTNFGKRAVKELEKNKIIIDVSHLSEKAFYDVAEMASKPFIATHSNSKTITSHIRNLSDDQFNIIKSIGGIVGINFHNSFLNNREDNASIDDIIKHTEYFLSLGGENTISIGTDFDGGKLPKDIKGIETIGEIYNRFLQKNYSETLLDKIFFKNAYNLCQNFDNL